MMVKADAISVLNIHIWWQCLGHQINIHYYFTDFLSAPRRIIHYGILSLVIFTVNFLIRETSKC